ncbi:chromosomal replication initiator protein DnaA [Eisenibacter elegans]|uniref:chromosomal replication initiator protein DnaA n=1 Tax=Eisenibacter elegans TaxID=997 RepID=UPI00047C874D|nr:chromosomal replication initiator protein DnaA [Eisenibacter elegans]
MQKDHHTIWETCLQEIKAHIDDTAFSTWFEPIVPVQLKDDVLTIQVPSMFFYEWIEGNYVVLLRRALDKAIGETARLEYTLEDTTTDKPNPNRLFGVGNQGNPYFPQGSAKAPHPKTPTFNGGGYIQQQQQQQAYVGQQSIRSHPLYAQFQLNPEYTFDSFIEGDCNRLARSAGVAVAERPGVTAFNPLMLYGGVGLGKTHLMQAIGNYIRKHHGEKQVFYVSSDRFTNQFVMSITNNDLQSFNNFYMGVDILLIDDVQFFSGKDKTQEIFFHIFNHLHQSGKQIIMTSDRPPKELKGLEDRLLSRFKWGLTADLKQPDLETRMAIIHKKMQSESTEMPDEVVEYLANSIDSNIRELEGVMTSLTAQASLYQCPITLMMAKNAVQQIVQNGGDRELSIDEIQQAVGEYFGISVEDMKSKTRKKEIVIARQVAMFFVKEHANSFSLKSIGYHFGGRDHSTVIHAIQTINDYIQTRTDVRTYVDEIRQKLKSL